MKDLSCVDKREQDCFLNSFDYVLCDVDGVLRRFNDDIPGAKDAIKSLKDLNKKIIFVSNNNTRSHNDYYNQLKSSGYDFDKNDLIIPVLAMVDFLKKQQFSKEIFLIGMTPMRTHLENAGYKIETFAYNNPEESVPKYVKECITLNKNVGAVIADIDINMKSAYLQRANAYLKNPDIIFITGGSDKTLYFGEGQILIGPGSFHAILEDMSGRKPHCLAKPSPELNDYIKEKFNISDPNKVLFIGDSVPDDMGFATNCGYKKLLVLTGLTQREDVEEWTFLDEFKPDYYVNSLKSLHDVITKR